MNKVNSTVLFLVSIFGLTSCVSTIGTGYDSNYGSSRPVPKDSVAMTEKWFLTKLNNGPYQGQRITLEISTDKRVSGFSGCNRYFASVDVLRGDQLKFGTVGSTRKLCADPNSNQLERKYLDVMRDVTHFNKSNNRLVLKGSSGNLVFYKKSVR